MDARLDSARRRRVLLDHLDQCRRVVLGTERGPACQQLVKNRSKGVDVGKRPDLMRLAGRLLRGHVAGSADHRPGLRLSQAGERRVGELLRQAEVRHLRHPGGRQKDVRRLQIAVDDAVLVDEVHRPGQSADQFGRLHRRDRRRADLVGEASPLDVLEREKRLPLMLADLVDGDDVRMLEPADGKRLGSEAMEFALVGMFAGEDHFDRDPAVEAGLPGAIDDPHPAMGHAALDAIAGDFGKLERMHFRRGCRDGVLRRTGRFRRGRFEKPADEAVDIRVAVERSDACGLKLGGERIGGVQRVEPSGAGGAREDVFADRGRFLVQQLPQRESPQEGQIGAGRQLAQGRLRTKECGHVIELDRSIARTGERGKSPQIASQ